MKVGDIVRVKLQKHNAPTVEGRIVYTTPSGLAVDVEYTGGKGRKVIVRRGSNQVDFIASGSPTPATTAEPKAKPKQNARSAVKKAKPATGGKSNPSRQRPTASESIGGHTITINPVDVPCPLCGARRHLPCRDTKVFHNERHVSRDGAVATITAAKELYATGEIDHETFVDEVISAVGIGHPVVEWISPRIANAKAELVRQDAERRARLRRLREESAALGGYRLENGGFTAE